MPIKMISRGGHRYRNRMMTAGEEFEVAGQSDAKLMRALKWADDKPAVQVTAPSAPVRVDEQSAEPRSYFHTPRTYAPAAKTSSTATKRVAAKKTASKLDE